MAPKPCQDESFWLDRIPETLKTEIENLKKNDAKVMQALKNPTILELFLKHPPQALSKIGIPVSDALLHRPESTEDLNRIFADHHFLVNKDREIIPDINLHITSSEDDLQLTTYSLTSNTALKPFGINTHGYNLVIEMSDGPYQVLGQNIFTESLFEKIATVLGIIENVFSVTIKMGHPTDVPYDRSIYPEVIDFHLEIFKSLGDLTPLSEIRFVTSLGADSSGESIQIYLNIGDCAYAQVTTSGLEIMNTFVWNTTFTLLLSRLNLLTIPKGKDSKSLSIQSIDVRVIDDNSRADGNALALLVMFESGPGGDRTRFTRSLIPPGKISVMEIDFTWIVRLLSAPLQNLTGLKYQDGIFTGDSVINEEHNVHLTRLALGVPLGKEDIISIQATLQTSGFCYTASANMEVIIECGITGNKLVVPIPQLPGSPQIDVDIPWYCYLLSWVIGSTLGPIFAGSLGALVGTMMPLEIYLGKESFINIFEDIMNEAIDTFNSNYASKIGNTINFPFDFVPIEVHIDDIAMYGSITPPPEQIKLLSHGDNVFIGNQYCLNMDDGIISAAPGANGAELEWTGSSLKTIGNTKFSSTNFKELSEVTLYQLYQLSYNSNASLDRAQLLGNVFAVETNTGRSACFKILMINDTGLWLSYKTYPQRIDAPEPSIDIVGGFKVTRPIYYYNDPLPHPGPGPFDPPNSQKHKKQDCIGEFEVRITSMKPPYTISWWLNGQPLNGAQGSTTLNGTKIQYKKTTDDTYLTLTISPPVAMLLEIKAQVIGSDGQSLVDAVSLNTPTHWVESIPPKLADYIKAYKVHIGPWQEVQIDYLNKVNFNRIKKNISLVQK